MEGHLYAGRFSSSLTCTLFNSLTPVCFRDGGLSFREAKEIRRRCGSSNPPTVRSSGQVLWMRFLTDKKSEEKGFTMKVAPVNGKGGSE